MSQLLQFSLNYINKYSFNSSKKMNETKFMNVQLGIIVLLLLLLGGQRRQNYGNLTTKVI